MSARRGFGLLAERPHLLVAGVGQPLGARRDHHLALPVAAFELKAKRFKPIEVLDAFVAVEADLVEVGVRRDRDEVLVHLVGTVVMAGGLLYRGAAAEIEVAAGHRAGAAGRGRLLQHEDVRSRRRGADRRAAARDAEADHQDIDLVGPRLDIGRVDGVRNVETAHCCSCFT